MSYPVLFWAAAIPLGLLCVGFSPSVLTSSQPGHVSGGVLVAVVGLVLVGEGTVVLLFTAREVVRDCDGRVCFTSWRRTLCVAPGELKSIRCIWLDPNRLAPMMIRSNVGRILIFPRIPDAKGLFDAMRQLNPQATVTSPIPFGLGRLRRD